MTAPSPVAQIAVNWERVPERAATNPATGASVGLRQVPAAFRQSTGLPPHRWLARQRIEQALALLVDTALPLAGVAAQTGYADPSYFVRASKRATGATPLAYRRDQQS